jgi:hypothetical protein
MLGDFVFRYPLRRDRCGLCARLFLLHRVIEPALNEDLRQRPQSSQKNLGGVFFV